MMTSAAADLVRRCQRGPLGEGLQGDGSDAHLSIEFAEEEEDDGERGDQEDEVSTREQEQRAAGEGRQEATGSATRGAPVVGGGVPPDDTEAVSSIDEEDDDALLDGPRRQSGARAAGAGGRQRAQPTQKTYDRSELVCRRGSRGNTVYRITAVAIQNKVLQQVLCPFRFQRTAFLASPEAVGQNPLPGLPGLPGRCAGPPNAMPAVAPTVAPAALRQTCDRSSPRAAPSRRGIPSAAPPTVQ